MGLTIAGMASTLLTTVFGLFHVDVFLRVYDLPLTTFATGNLIFSVINTANDVAGAWIADAFASESSRSSIIGLSGCLFAVCFLSPFFRWRASSSSLWDGVHFVTSMSLYDSMFSFTTILIGSVVTDDHTISDHARVRFMASGKVVNLVASLAVARFGLAVFSGDDMKAFRIFVLILCMLVCVLFLIAQWKMTPGVIMSWGPYASRTKTQPKTAPDMTNVLRSPRKRKLRFRQVVRDFWTHDNFRAWIGMEMLLECQHGFVSSFLKTFIDRLAVGAGVPREACDWLLSLLHPLKGIAGILCYVPIRHMGYHKVYTWMFRGNLILSAMCLAFASPSHPYLIIMFLLTHTVMTGAVQSAGFHLAMSDMVLEMKRRHAVLEGRFDEPSLAGLFMGANALLCKPMESVLPIVAAFFLGRTDFSSNAQSEDARWVLFYLLVVPPLLFSCLQLLSWRKYTLHPERTDRMRKELEKMESVA
jgi:Na+/melibiose symporter-like transporter